jgi:4-amino-4-deoxy-L-arabinose transferase-like glycosyltransferase
VTELVSSDRRGRRVAAPAASWAFPTWLVAALPLTLVVLVGFALRVYDIAGNPTELIVDELDLYNSAHAIATTGRDVDGSLLPFLWSAFTRNPPMYALAEYITSLFFGAGAFGLRLPAVLFGTSCIALMYAIAFELTRRRDVAIVTALLVATQPILVHFSRVAWEPASELPFLLGGLYVLLRAFVRVRPGDRASLRGLALAAILLAGTCYTYMAGWFYAVVLAVPIVVANWKRLRSPRALFELASAFAIWAALAEPALGMWFSNRDTFARTQRIATFGNGITIDALRQFVANYFAHFHWSYLVTTGDPISGATWRYLSGFGAFYGWVVVFAIGGAFVALRYVRPPWALAWLFWWVVVYPLGGSLTNEGVPNAPRTLAGTPVFCVFAAFGLVMLFDFAARLPRAWRARAKFALRAAFVASLAVSVSLFMHYYFARFPYVNPNAWDSGTRQLFGAIRANAPGEERLCFSVRQAWYGADTYMRYYLAGVPLERIQDVSDPRCTRPGTLLATDALALPHGFKIVATIPEMGGSRFAVLAER